MKFLAFVGLLCGASAIKLVQHQTVPVAHHFAKARRDIKLTPEQEKEIKDWVSAELADGGTITKDEAWDALMAFGEKHGFAAPTEEEKEWLEAQFDETDLNDDGEIDWKELKKKLDQEGISYVSMHKSALAKLMKGDVDEAAVVKDVLEWADEKLSTGDKLISWWEVRDGVQALARKYKQELPKGWKKAVKEVFDVVDADGSGKIDAKEWDDAVKAWSAEQ